MAWTKIDDPTTTWTIVSIGGWFITEWFYGWFRNLVPAIWTKIDDPVTVWTVI